MSTRAFILAAKPMMTSDEQIDFFFRAPHLPHTGPQTSVLYLARREVQLCLIDGPVRQESQAIIEAVKQSRRVFASTMVMMAAIDLMAKMYCGSDSNGGAGERIKRFAEDFIFTGMASAETFADVLYHGCRNPLLHSFTLHNEADYEMFVMTGQDVVMREVGPNQFFVGIEGLYRAFVDACGQYEQTVRTNQERQKKFAAMFPKYGAIVVGVWTANAEPL